jgi:DNA-directed RNA polymerase specialized sigma24 family protein
LSLSAERLTPARMDSLPESKETQGFELEKRIDEINRSPRLRREIFANVADRFEWKGERLWPRRFVAERAAARGRGNVRKLAYDAARAVAFNDFATVDWFLKSFLRLHPYTDKRLLVLITQEDLRDALRRVLVEQWLNKPAELLWKKRPGWLRQDSVDPTVRLRAAVRNEAKRIARDRDVADEPWGLDRLRNKNLPVQREFIPEEHSPTGGEDILSELHKFQRRERELFLKKSAQVLPERQCQVFALRARGRSYKEIGHEMEITESAAKSHMSHARRNAGLQRIIAEQQWK